MFFDFEIDRSGPKERFRSLSRDSALALAMSIVALKGLAELDHVVDSFVTENTVTESATLDNSL